MNLEQAVLSQSEAMIRSLQESLRIPSVQGPAVEGAPYGVEVRRCLDHALDTACRLGFSVTDMDHQMGWCEYGEGEEMVAVLGHLDVVPEGDDWSFEPYGGEVRDGMILGRGTTDDKGPTIAALYALAAIKELGLPIRRRIRLFFGTNEETGSNDMKYYVSHGGEMPVMGFTPDGEYPVINGEKGIINVTFAKKYTQENSNIKLVRIQGGLAPNVVPAHAEAEFACEAKLAEELVSKSIDKIHFSMTDTGFKVCAEGVGAHGSTPELGENAIGRLLQGLDTLPLDGELAEAIHFIAEKLGMETDGSSAGIYLEDDISGKLTLNLGVISGDESGLSIKINYRYPVTKCYDDCGHKFKSIFEEAGFILEGETHKASLYIPEDSELIQTLLRVYTEKTGDINGRPKSIGGGTYAKALPNTVAFGPIFPGDEVREHEPDEYIEVDKLIKNAQIIAAAMYELAK